MQHFKIRAGTVILDQHFHHHMRAHPINLKLLQEALENTTPPTSGIWKTSVDLQRIIGMQERVTTDTKHPEEPLLFARRIGRNTPSRVIHQNPTPTSHLSFVAVNAGQTSKSIRMITAYYGKSGIHEPNATSDINGPEIEFWCKNALCWNKKHYREEPFLSTWKRIIEDEWPLDKKHIPKRDR